MDYMGILKRAWDIVWRNKILWLFGFFVMSGSYGSSSRNTMSGDTDFQAPVDAATRWAEKNQLFILVLFVAFALLAIVFFVMRIAATGGLIHLVDEAENGRPVLAGDGFSVGFRRFWRVLGVQLLLALPIILVALVIAVVVVALLLVFGAAEGGAPAALAGATAAGVCGVCALVAVSLVVLVPLVIVLSVLQELALRYAVVSGLGVMDSIRAAWQDVRLRGKQVALIWLSLLAVGIAYGLAAFLLFVVLAIPGLLLLIAGTILTGGGLLLGALVALAIPGSVYSAFVSTTWTIFFRDMRGMPSVSLRSGPTTRMPSSELPSPPSSIPPATAPPE